MFSTTHAVPYAQTCEKVLTYNTVSPLHIIRSSVRSPLPDQISTQWSHSHPSANTLQPSSRPPRSLMCTSDWWNTGSRPLRWTSRMRQCLLPNCGSGPWCHRSRREPWQHDTRACRSWWMLWLHWCLWSSWERHPSALLLCRRSSNGIGMTYLVMRWPWDELMRQGCGGVISL